MAATIDAIGPAAGRIHGAFAEAAGVEVKALIPLGRQTVLVHTLRTLRATGRVGRVAVIGPGEAMRAATDGLADTVLREGATGIDNVFRGLAWLSDQSAGASSRILIVTSDLPFLTPNAVCGLLDAASHAADISVPVVASEAFDARFPGAPREYVRLRDGSWTIGCGFVANPSALLAMRPHVERVFAARKSQARMAMLLGLPFILRFATRRASVADVVARCSAILGARGEVVRGCAPELAFDIDSVEDWRYAIAASEAERSIAAPA
jgi:hypothetical protein